MSTLLYTHDAFLHHDTGPGHPEHAGRLRAVLEALEDDAFAALERHEAPQAEREQLIAVHTEAYVDAVLAKVPTEGRVHLDPDTVMSPGSGEAGLRAAGAVSAAVDAVMGGEAQNAFCAVRPPGHHAEADRAMGFCIFNNVAVGALHARARHRIERVAVVDFDVHHGNGTQHMFEADSGLFYGSTHQSPFYPGTGAAEERGVGNIVNLPLAAFSGSAEFRLAVERTLLPALGAFRPELVLVSAGFDAHKSDPLAQLELTEDDYAWVTRQLLAVAAEHCQGRLVSTLEGGYDLAALGTSAAAHVAELLAA